MNQNIFRTHDKIMITMLSISLSVVAISVVLGMAESRSFFEAYLFSYLFWLGLTVGAMPIVMLHHLTGGAWGFLVRRPLETAFQLTPIMLLLFIPLIFGLDELYPWTHPGAPEHSILEEKSWYLNQAFFFIRMTVYFLVMLGLMFYLNRWSRFQDTQQGYDSRLSRLSAVGLILYTLVTLFISTDLVMSLALEWYSSTFALLFGVSQMLSAMALGIAVSAYFSRNTSDFSRIVNENRLNDLGNLLLMFVLTWTYLAFTQYLIIWYENLPAEISWYYPRVETSWRWLGLSVIIFHFAAPFAILLLRKVKRSASRLGLVAAALVVIHIVEVYWTTMPILRQQGFEIQWIDILVFIGIGGLWSTTYAFLLKGKPLLPLQALELKKVMKDA